MEFKPLNRSAQEYAAAMTEWLGCTTLSDFERQIVERLKIAAECSVEEFANIRQFMVHNYALPITIAIAKARAQHLCTEWKQEQNA